MATTTASLKPWQTARDWGIVILAIGCIAQWVMPPAPPERYVPVGTVQSIHFFGNLGVQTQIDTRDAEGTERSFVVDRASRLAKGQEVVLHTGRWRSALCNVDHSVCEDLLGDPQ